MTKLSFPHSSNTYSTQDPSPKDEWGRVLTRTDWSFYGTMKIVKDKSQDSSDLTTTVDTVGGRYYYLVYVTYSTGSSFGNDNQSDCEYIELYETWKAGEACKVVSCVPLSPSPTPMERRGNSTSLGLDI